MVRVHYCSNVYNFTPTQYFETLFGPVDSLEPGASFEPFSVQFDVSQLEIELIEGAESPSRLNFCPCCIRAVNKERSRQAFEVSNDKQKKSIRSVAAEVSINPNWFWWPRLVR